MLLEPLAFITLCLYAAAAVLFFCGTGFKSRRLVLFGSRALFVGFIVHIFDLIALLLDETSGLIVDRNDYFFWLAFVLVLINFLLGKQLKYPIFGAFVSTAASLFLAGSSYTSYISPGTSIGESNFVFFLVHVIPALVAEVCLAFALIVSSVFLMIEKRLRTKTFDSITVKSPNLALTENLNFKFLSFGFICISLAIVTGAIWKVSHNQPAYPEDYAQWSAFLSWLLLGFLLQSKHRLGWSSVKIARATLIGAGIFFISLFLMVVMGSNVLHVSS